MKRMDWVKLWEVIMFVYRIYEPIIVCVLVLNFLLDLAEEHFDGR